jgi:uncharacterized membrane protein YccC
MSIACAICHGIATHVVISILDRSADSIGSTWAAVATVFVSPETRTDARSAGVARLIAAVVSFALCLLYLWFLPFTTAGMAALIGLGTLAPMLPDRRNDIVTTGITTVVVMVIAAISPQDAWHQPLMRPVDRIVGVGIGVACNWAASFLYFRIVGEPVQ